MNNAFDVVMLTIAGIGLAIGILAFVLDRLERRNNLSDSRVAWFQCGRG